jgi:hypothetical protein
MAMADGWLLSSITSRVHIPQGALKKKEKQSDVPTCPFF